MKDHQRWGELLRTVKYDYYNKTRLPTRNRLKDAQPREVPVTRTAATGMALSKYWALRVLYVNILLIFPEETAVYGTVDM